MGLVEIRYYASREMQKLFVNVSLLFDNIFIKEFARREGEGEPNEVILITGVYVSYYPKWISNQMKGLGMDADADKNDQRYEGA